MSLLELPESILQASDLGLLLIQHHDKTWVQFRLKQFLILNLFLQPGKKIIRVCSETYKQASWPPLYMCTSDGHTHTQTDACFKRWGVCLSALKNELAKKHGVDVYCHKNKSRNAKKNNNPSKKKLKRGNRDTHNERHTTESLKMSPQKSQV